MKVNILKLMAADFPPTAQMVDPLPKQLYVAGAPLESWIERPKVAIVGSRKASTYGLTVTNKLASELARSGVVIISGLALGIDAAAHQAALAAGGLTAAVLPTPLDQIYPPRHLNLSRQIIAGGGSLISEYGPSDPVYQVNFRNRNRIISGLADAVLVTEAALKSGSLVTARFGLEQGKTVLAVPGNINSPGSEGCNNLIKAGALPVTGVDDIFFALGLKLKKKRSSAVFRGSQSAERIYKMILDGVSDQEELALRCQLDGAQMGSYLTELELAGVVKPAGAGQWIAA